MGAIKVKNADGTFSYYGGIKGDKGEAGTPGAAGTPGTNGTNGTNGWTPVFAVVADGERRVLQVTDWTGGTGTKPATGQYVGATGLTATLANGIDIRGSQGPQGTSTGLAPTIVDAKGDILAATAPDTVVRFPVGATTGHVLTVDPASSVGISWAAPAAPATMLTTDTAQVLAATGVKTFPPGTLLMRNPAGTETAEPYSDVNPPSSLEMTLAATPVNPTTGEATLFTTDGASLSMRSSGGVTTLIGPSAGGGGASDPLPLATDFSTTSPAVPATGLTIFARHRTRRLLASIGPSGQDTAYQPAMFANRIARVTVINNTAVPIYDGIAVTAYAAAPALQANASTNFYTSMVRNRYSSTATAGTIGGFRSATTQWFLSSTANLGGFFFVCRFGLGVITTTNRIFVGLRTGTASATSATEAAIPNGTQPSTLLNCVGFGADAADSTMQLLHNDATGAAIKTNLGTNFPAQTAATNFYEVRLFAPSGGGQNVRWSITRLNDGAFSQGQITTDLPALGTMLAAHVTHSNGTTGAVASLDLQSLYVETDN